MMEILKKQSAVLDVKLGRLYERIEYFPWTLHGRIEQVDVDYLRREQVQLEREICTMNLQICAPAGQWNPVGQVFI